MIAIVLVKTDLILLIILTLKWENIKSAQVVLYEHLIKSDGAALISFPIGNSNLLVSGIDYNLSNELTGTFWRNLHASPGIRVYAAEELNSVKGTGKVIDLMTNGPVKK